MSTFTGSMQHFDCGSDGKCDCSTSKQAYCKNCGRWLSKQPYNAYGWCSACEAAAQQRLGGPQPAVVPWVIPYIAPTISPITVPYNITCSSATGATIELSYNGGTACG